jgi:hypothetical protein
VLLELLDQDLDAVQVRGLVLAVGFDGALELVERLFGACAVPQDLAAAVVRLGAAGICAQGFIQPRERFVRLAVGGRLHRLVQAIPVAISIEHVVPPGPGAILANRPFRLLRDSPSRDAAKSSENKRKTYFAAPGENGRQVAPTSARQQARRCAGSSRRCALHLLSRD